MCHCKQWSRPDFTLSVLAAVGNLHPVSYPSICLLMSKLNFSPSVSLPVPLPQSNGGGVHGHHHGGSEGSNQRAGEADTERRPIQVSHLHGEYSIHTNVLCFSTHNGSVEHVEVRPWLIGRAVSAKISSIS